MSWGELHTGNFIHMHIDELGDSQAKFLFRQIFTRKKNAEELDLPEQSLLSGQASV